MQWSAATIAFNAVVLNQSQLSAALNSWVTWGTNRMWETETQCCNPGLWLYFLQWPFRRWYKHNMLFQKLTSHGLLHPPTPSHHSKQIWPYFYIEPTWVLDFTGVILFQQEISFATPWIENLLWPKISKANLCYIREYKFNLLAEFNWLANLPESWISLQLERFLVLLVMINLGIFFKAYPNSKKIVWVFCLLMFWWNYASLCVLRLWNYSPLLKLKSQYT